MYNSYIKVGRKESNIKEFITLSKPRDQVKNPYWGQKGILPLFFKKFGGSIQYKNFQIQKINKHVGPINSVGRIIC